MSKKAARIFQSQLRGDKKISPLRTRAKRPAGVDPPLAMTLAEETDPDAASLCGCGHLKNFHRENFSCTLCSCVNFQYAEKSALQPAAPEVNSEAVEQSTSVSGVKIMEIVRQAVQPAKSNAAVYNVPGLRGTIRIARRLLAGPAPERFTVEGLTFAEPSAPKVKLTKEERKAANASKSPLDKIAEQEERLRVQAANLARRKQELAAMEASA
jgi:hypothetical protein